MRLQQLRIPVTRLSLRYIMSAVVQNVQGPGPVEVSMREKLTASLRPVSLTINNDSSQHRHHAAMRSNEGNGETHFSIAVVSEEFRGKGSMQRHRMIYALLKEELSNGLHALSLKTKTPEEVDSGNNFTPK